MEEPSTPVLILQELAKTPPTPLPGERQGQGARGWYTQRGTWLHGALPKEVAFAAGTVCVATGAPQRPVCLEVRHEEDWKAQNSGVGVWETP